MKILFCLGSFSRGGAERVIANLANNLDSNIEISIILTKDKGMSYKTNNNTKFYILDDNKLSKNFLLKNIKRITKLNKLIKEIKPDVIVSFLPEPSYRVLFLKPFHKIPVIVSVRNDPKKEYSSKLNNLVMKMLYKKADGFVFQTVDAKNYFSKKIQDKSVIIYNPINNDFLENCELKPKKEIITIGRLEEQKNHRLLIDAFNLIKDDFKDYKLIIYGKGSLHDILLQKIKDLNLEKRVILYGEVEDVKEKLISSSLFVLPSSYEGMPNALIEAMAVGLPVISTDCPCGGPKTLIKNEQNGLLVPIDDVYALAKAMKKILENDKLRNKIKSNAKKIINLVEPKKISYEWLDFINKVLSDKR